MSSFVCQWLHYFCLSNCATTFWHLWCPPFCYQCVLITDNCSCIIYYYLVRVRARFRVCTPISFTLQLLFYRWVEWFLRLCAKLQAGLVEKCDVRKVNIFDWLVVYIFSLQSCHRLFVACKSSSNGTGCLEKFIFHWCWALKWSQINSRFDSLGRSQPSSMSSFVCWPRR